MHPKKNLGIKVTKNEKDIVHSTHGRKEMKNMCVEGGQNVWVKDLEGNTNKWKHTPCSLTGRVNYVNMSIVPKAIDRCDEIPI